MLEITRKMRRRWLRVAIRMVAIPLGAASAVTWGLEGIRARLQTKLALEELTR